MIEIYVSKKDAPSLEQANILAEHFNVELHVLKCKNEEFPFYLSEALAYAPVIAVHYLSRGVTLIPAVVFDGKCIFCGYVPSPNELRDVLLKHTPWEQLLKNVEYEEISLEKAREAYLMENTQKQEKKTEKTPEKKSSRRKKKTNEEKTEAPQTEEAPNKQEKQPQEDEGKEKQSEEAQENITAMNERDTVDSLVEFVPDAVKE
ncbi:MAG: hypothetical protein JHC26_00410 [Thermofilum sp.]|jgi:hypothetical protein|uniref:hypothetical protein n=1 Tax=Thermofilum sp. TaxID=1961369 RepID=UPI00258A4BFB|nr:hypothetical protein [Thermofilum sp.]MCI4407527.1 hypothetical protein [Thermofilum sp.]